MQTVDIAYYHKMVDDFGIEDAYKMRHRATGRTVRDVLALARLLSEGKKVIIITSEAPSQTRYAAIHVLRQVRDICKGLGMDVGWSGESINYDPSGGEIAIQPDTELHRRVRPWRSRVEYKLHEA